ncbi:hypothetical protein [Clostridium sp. AM58-1XD]|uniref:hypothetical protein n=1 Tax=Clostridium sp. AM58-1XD TaxID=2292307 RepID=UPI000E520699|nr:hypothetical protein [Clostridium sp. AM58-1XD]RGZ00128.1 hypothetical protein DXA13_05795 [Clostridium sp. AM58-1XD]
MKKKLMILAAAGCMTLAMTIPAFAGEWQQNGSGWWYDNGDGTYPAECWKWIDGDGDGTAECYYFDKEGYMLSGVTTPDGKQVNESGKWIQEGVVQTKDSTSVQDQSVALASLEPASVAYFVYLPDTITDAAGNTYTKPFAINCREDRGSCYCMYDNNGYTRLRADKVALAKGSVGEIAQEVVLDIYDAKSNKLLYSTTVTPQTEGEAFDVDIVGHARIKLAARVTSDQGDSAYVILENLRFAK